MAEVMEASVSDRKEEGAAANQGEDGPKLKRASLKRKSEVKTKKQKRVRLSRSHQPDYTVHQGEDMLLVISNASSQYIGSGWTPRKKGSRKRKVATGKFRPNQMRTKKTTGSKPKLENGPAKEDNWVKKPSVSQTDVRDRWGQTLPEEVLVNIFQMVVVQDGAVPFLCRVGRVCRLWNAAASSPVLWRRVTVGHCWVDPGKIRLPNTERKIQDTVTWLAQNRFSQLRDFSLCHWKKNADFMIEAVSRFCPQLRSLRLSYCKSVTAKAFRCLGLHSRCLQSIDLQQSEFQVEGLLEFLENHGKQIRQILFTHGLKNDRVLAAVSRGCCPDLELLEVNKRLDSKDGELPVCMQQLQMACPKLKTFRMLNVRPLHKMMRNGAASSTGSGFPLLEELCIATTAYSYMTDRDLREVLFGSTKLRVLDLRGCSRITPSALAALPCPELECLFWGQYSSQFRSSSMMSGLTLLTQKWGPTLQQLDIANQPFTEEDLELAMSYLTQTSEAETLRFLNLSGTRITPPALRSVVRQMTALNYLNLSSCRYLPRGLKKIYRSQEEICELLDKLEGLPEQHHLILQSF
ncbi:F-box/LRR-repeat protein 6 isoform X3 [Nothobranchius furzeri]|nr:F-box/LRR-repeat protein 6 isoform X3 [Nothobranchius furzeri]XP_015829586.1 F-box/LRR-repeat protein 6 isoform X3 [Nothobranchius furzeri]KAF7211455.1 transcript variant X3 [Nothobranchius furzeri]KAF7211456.1 transcript variant X4 [Nothobranchius furzeri]